MPDRAVVVTVTVVFPCGVTDAGFAVQVVRAAGDEQVKVTAELKPFCPFTAMVKLAGLPAFTVTLVGACAVNVKSGVGVCVPVPLRGKECGLPAASLVTAMLALFAPVLVGAKLTPNVQLTPGARLLVPATQVKPLAGEVSRLK
jgi:hypothetical protein